MMEVEEWRIVVSYSAKYQVSNLGRVRRTSDHLILRIRLRKGYPTVCLSSSNKKKTETVHTMVAIAFNGPRPNGMVIRHLDGNRAHNAATNLAWGTVQQNANDRIAHGRSCQGEGHWQSKLNKDVIVDIRQRIASGEKDKAIGELYGVTSGAIAAVRTGQTWQHVA